MKNSLFQDILRDFVSLIYPTVCEACHRPLVKGENVICTYCIIDLPRSNYHNESNNPLTKRFQGRVPVKHAMAFLKFRKKGPVQRLLHSLKYRNRPEVGVKLGQVYGAEMTQAGLNTKFDLIVPVPLHPSRLRYRGYNQSEKWGMGLSATTKIPMEGKALQRIRRTNTQTKRTKLNRWENVREVFRVKNPEVVHNKRILLVDDVVTTGATLEACCQALLSCGCAEIGIACIALVE